MRITIDSTDTTVHLNGVLTRMWQGHTDSGIEVHCFITRIAAPKEADLAQFERELQEHKPLRAELAAYPLRMFLD